MTTDDRSEDRAPIAVLPPYLADQIAAGEVVERPASALKELVDNAIDAGATRVEVLLEGGGTHRIRVIDDGIGIRPDELHLALRRHATSKLRSADELLDVASLGFRGEALASIASVARVALKSRVAGAATGFELVSDPLDAMHGPDGGSDARSESTATSRGEAASVAGLRPVGMPLGTQIEINELFAAVPARRKFLRSVATETAHCVEVVLRIALVHPDVELSLQHDGRALLHFPRQDLDARVRRILERRGVERVHQYATEVNGVSLRAWLGDVSSAQSSGALSVIVRRRVVVERSLTKILYTALGPSPDPDPQTRRCAGVLMLEPGAGSVDVNVHPQKLEVRFSDPQRIYSALRQAAAQWRSERDAMAVSSSHDPSAQRDPGASSRAAQAADERGRRQAHLVELSGQHASTADDRQHRESSDRSDRIDRGDRGYALRTRATQPDYEQQRQSVRVQVEALAALSRRDDESQSTTRRLGDVDVGTSSLWDAARIGDERRGSQLAIEVSGAERAADALGSGDSGRTDEGGADASRWGAHDPSEPGSAVGPSDADAGLATGQHQGERTSEPPSDPRQESTGPTAEPAPDPVIIGALPGGVVLLLHDQSLYAMELTKVRDELAFRRLAEEVRGEHGVAIQRLLHPIVLRKSAAEIELLARSSELLHPLGLDLEPFGEDCVALRGVPASLGWLAEMDQVGILVDRALAWLRLRASSRDPLTLLGALARAPTAADHRYAKRWLKELVLRLRREAADGGGSERLDLGGFPGLHRWQAHELVGRPHPQVQARDRDDVTAEPHRELERRGDKPVAEPSR